MAKKVVDKINIEHARIIFRNFTGVEKKYNQAGKRNFHAVIEDPEMAQTLTDIGWNIRIRQFGEGDDITVIHTLPVEVNYAHIPPKIYLVNRRGVPVLMAEDDICQLDHVEFVNIDLIIRPRLWDDDGETRIKAYLETMYVTIEEDPFAHKYSAAKYSNDDDDLPF